MTIKGQIISGDFSRIIARQKTDTPIQLGELLIHESENAKTLLQAIDLSYGSQISQQNLELISGMHVEEDQPINLYDEKLRNYPLVHLKSLLSISQSDATLAKSLPQCFGTIRQITKEDMSFLPKHQDALTVGKMRSGSTQIDVDISLPLKKVLSHHILIPATTGKGKSNLMSTILWNTIQTSDCAMLVFDPHDEYYGRNTPGLKDHPAYNSCGSYYTPSNIPPGAYSLTLNLELLQPKHFSGVTDFSFPQQELLAVYYNQFKEKWIESLLTKQPINFEFNEATFAVVHRRLCRLLDISVSENGIDCHGLFSQQAGKSFFTDIIKQIEESKTIIIDTSSLTGDAELLIASLISSAVFDKYRYYRKCGTLDHKPIVSIVLEEAPRVIGKEVLEKGPNVFGTIAKEGRKFHVGLCAITQLPSLIPKEILANMNTKIILGIEMATERSAIIESAAQDLSDDSRSIASLDKGEAIITSNFARFAIPVKIPFFPDLVKSVEKVEKKLVGI